MTADEQQDLFVLGIFVRTTKSSFTYTEIKEIAETDGVDISDYIFNLKDRGLLQVSEYPMSGYVQQRYSIISLGKLRYNYLLSIQKKEDEEELRSKRNLKFSKIAARASIAAVIIAILSIIVTIIIYYSQKK